MKKLLRTMALAVVALLTATTMQSCLDDDDDDSRYIIDPVGRGNMAVVTLKTNATTGLFYMQLNDSVTLIPNNIKTSPYGNKELRAVVSFAYADSAVGHYSRSVDAAIMDTIRTKPMSPLVDNINNVYGNDPLEIVDDSFTVCEDDYLTLHFRTYFGGVSRHSLYLVRTGDDTVELHHNANGDTRQNVADGFIAFRLSDMPDTGGHYVPLTLKWTSFSGEKSVTFKYKSRE